MYPNVNAEIGRLDLTLEKLGEMMGKSTSTMSAMLTGRTRVTLDDAVKIKSILHSELPLEELFARREA